MSAEFIAYQYEIIPRRVRAIFLRQGFNSRKTASFVDVMDSLFKRLKPEQTLDIENRLLELIADPEIDKNVLLSNKTPIFMWAAIIAPYPVVKAMMDHPDVDVNAATSGHNSLTALASHAHLRAKRDGQPFKKPYRETLEVFEMLIGDQRINTTHAASYALVINDKREDIKGESVMACLERSAWIYRDHVHAMLEKHTLTP